MTLIAEQFAFLHDVSRLIEFCYNRGIMVTGGELYRTPEQQEIYLKTGKSKTSNSNHLRRLAIDLNFIIGGKLVYDKAAIQPYGNFWKSLNPLNRWGGEFSNIADTDHFERNV